MISLGSLRSVKKKWQSRAGLLCLQSILCFCFHANRGTVICFCLGPTYSAQCKAADLVRRVGLRSRCQNLLGLEQELVWFMGWSVHTNKIPFGETQLEALCAPNVLQTLLRTQGSNPWCFEPLGQLGMFDSKDEAQSIKGNAPGLLIYRVLGTSCSNLHVCSYCTCLIAVVGRAWVFHRKQ